MKFNLIDPSSSIVVESLILWESPVLGRFFSNTSIYPLTLNLLRNKTIIAIKVALMVIAVLLMGMSMYNLRESYGDIDFITNTMKKNPEMDI